MISERYLECRNEIHIHMFLADSGEYCAVFYRAGANDVLATIGRQAGHEEPSSSRGEQQIQIPAFVDVVQVSERPQGTIPCRVASIARLQVGDACDRRRAHVPDFTLPPGALEAARLGIERESGFVGGGLRRLPIDPPDLLAALRVELTPDGIWFGSEELPELMVEGIVMFASPREVTPEEGR